MFWERYLNISTYIYQYTYTFSHNQNNTPICDSAYGNFIGLPQIGPAAHCVNIPLSHITLRTSILSAMHTSTPAYGG